MVWRAGSSRADPPKSHRIREDPMRGSLRCARIPSIRVLAECKRIEPNRCCGQMTRGNIKITTSQKTSKKMVN
ncbi:hypothetical protein Taro_029968 [Colocasia esculenta]|uniref:Uncharacterized protein n=1 Tax=Colocasia esculenta TaxID=4460 RepID=A0A843W1W2_COLES|nr:hypothetical protein [Colocasia esculenta]